MNEIAKKCIEPDCGAAFTMTEEQVLWFEKKGFQLPKRCKECRERKKRENGSPFGEVARIKRKYDKPSQD